MDAGAPALLGEPNDAEDGLLLRRLDSLDQPVPVVDTPVRIHSCGKLLGLAQRHGKATRIERDRRAGNLCAVGALGFFCHRSGSPPRGG